MIIIGNSVFHLSTKNTSYIVHVDESNHVVCDYYGKRIEKSNDYRPLFDKIAYPFGCSVVSSDSTDGSTCLDSISNEYSTCNVGNYNEPSFILKNDDGFTFDFIFDRFEIFKGNIKLPLLPYPHGECEELVLYISDKIANISAELHYFVFEESDIILRNVKLKNRSDKNLAINKIMSMELNLINNKGYEIVSFYGGWAQEFNKEIHKISHGIFVNDSKTGNSSNRHNPFFMVKGKNTDENYGDVYAFNFIYSGNFEEKIELTSFNKINIEIGISSYCFEKILGIGKEFVTPLAVMSYSNQGLNDVSHHMHDFINNNIVPEVYAHKTKPVVINNWEATGMKFNEAKILSIAKEAKKHGIELFVLDDGWFKDRNDDTNGLSNYEVDANKLPNGLSNLAKKINSYGLKFGLWFEPEMISEKTDLFQKHPEYALTCPRRKPNLGRNQLVLDLTNIDVRRYIVTNLDKILNSANIEYIKWDMNRNISDISVKDNGAFYYDYMLGLYEILNELRRRHPSLLIEMCASGGNRFDLGMLCYSSQIWTSDDTDAYQRIQIQSGASYGYPLSCISNHVSDYTSQQLLRKIPLQCRFNVASFGVLGYEFNLKTLSKVDEIECNAQIKFYKEHQELFQYGDFYQFMDITKDGYTIWEVISKDKSQAIIGVFSSLQKILNPTFVLFCSGFDDKSLYKIEVRQHQHNLKLFGNLINYVSPVHLEEQGKIVDMLSKTKTVPGEKEEYIVSGEMLNSGGVKLKQEWSSVGFNENVRVLGDFGSRLYFVNKYTNDK